MISYKCRVLKELIFVKKMLYSLAIVVVMVCVVFGCNVKSYAVYNSYFVNDERDLKLAVSTADNTDSIVLTQDIYIQQDIKIESSITLDLNGYMYTEITSNGSQLFGQATGQPAFPLYPTSENAIGNKDIDVEMAFDFYNHKFTAKQNGMEFEFVKSAVETSDSQPIDAEQFAKYTGSYGSDALKMDVKVFIDNNKLMAQASGQQSFPLSPTAEDAFEFKMGGIEMKFDVANQKMTLKQRGMEFEFVKK